ncbi:uncharacterized protein Z518_09130 [Rhinocladiella mackenziei CBS 650.93]|uniref:Rhinocladiella mackenziei CBS 650.93 unplaced genomic scaffold supercont1.7, whole genome shotgun sequence n=1 Tax=Rhinocladiella mackenziei CBS 650.93 TaxID=1442369 RepID=A0A0D2I6H1_9EURO|nr:uncharacterized protein Z518_09130 [Rhinocladiella mackenziei CBS 650.93]KIX01404.1 hypothetical protein Z518_09130 [Rhinocladiella mackenziei CBS 650.93]
MRDEVIITQIKESLAKDSRDVADLWNDALRKYKGITGVDLSPNFTSVDAMIAFGTNQMNNFHQFRHNQKKVDKLRGLFIANLGYIQQGAQQLIAAATPAFPPAAAIGTALTYMLSACKQVSADYDVITAFFEDMNAFLQRITILESRLPKYPAYRNCLMDVFTSVLEMCGFATKYIELGRFKRRRQDPSTQGSGKAAGQNKRPTSNRVRSFFGDTMNPAHEYNSIKDNFIDETCTWIFDEPIWDPWLVQGKGKAAPRILTIEGPPGAGKSYLAVSAYDQLIKLADSNTCVTKFYFRESPKDLGQFCNAINWVVIQIAEQNAVLCEKINIEIGREDLDLDTWVWEDIWTDLVKPLFSGSSQARLQIVWDGLDELQGEEREKLLQFFSEFKDTTDLNITFLCTTRPDLSLQLKKIGSESIAVTKEKQLSDMKLLIWSHLNNDSGLRKFSRYVKQRISSTIEEKADGMLYVEHILRQLSILGREHLVLKQTGPASRKSNELRAMKSLLWWLAFSYQPLSLDECLALLELTPGNSFDLERELQGRQLARFLKIGDPEERVGAASPQPSMPLTLIKNNPDAAYHDGDLPLKFQERAMRDFFRHGQSGDSGLRTSAAEAHREIFVICSKILCDPAINVPHGLRKYAAEKWAVHLSETRMAQGSETDRITGVEALGAIMTNEANAAMRLESLGVDYDKINKNFPKFPLLSHVASFAQMADSLDDKVTASTSVWVKSVVSDEMAAFVPLAKGHLENWLQTADLKSALRSYKFARSAIKLTGHRNPIVQGEEDDTDSSSVEDDEGEMSWYREEEIIAISQSFENIVRGSNTPWAVALLLEHSRHHDAALSYAQDALSECKEPIRHFQILDLVANIYLRKKDYNAANKAINDALSNREVSPKLLRNGLVTRAKTEVALGKVDDAMASYAEARYSDQEPMPGDILQAEFKLYVDKHADAKLIGLVKEWKKTERLDWMTWRYEEDYERDIYHPQFQRAAGKAGEHQFLVEAYEEAITLLDRLNAAPPIRFQLALVHRYIRGDIDAAKALMDENLDASSTGEPYRFTNEDPAMTLVRTVILMTDLIYEQFRSTGDPVRKMQLFAEIKGLTNRNLAQSISTLKSSLVHHTITVAKMARKMGPAQDFQAALENAFSVCYESLTDDVEWNDWLNLTNLSAVLSNMSGLDREARILVSAQFSRLALAVTGGQEESEKDYNGTDEESEEDDDNSNDVDSLSEEDGDINDWDPLPDDEGDLVEVLCLCSGECDPIVSWRAWKGRPMYRCGNTILCEPCYQKRQAYNKGAHCEIGRTYCGRDHQYIKGPIEGWKGIKNGVMKIDNQEPVKFKDWLEDLKNNKWKEAWERFWMVEG